MIVAIELCQTDLREEATGEYKGEVVYTNAVATFQNEAAAMRFAKDDDAIMLVNCETGEMIKTANVSVEITEE